MPYLNENLPLDAVLSGLDDGAHVNVPLPYLDVNYHMHAPLDVKADVDVPALDEDLRLNVGAPVNVFGCSMPAPSDDVG